MSRPLFVIVVAVLVAGCNKPASTGADGKPLAKADPPAEQPKPKPDEAKPGDMPAKKDVPPAEEAKTVQQAREEMQSRIDRYLGGARDTTRIGGTFSIWQVGKRVNNIEIVRVGQAYLPDGKPWTNTFVVVIKCSATRDVTGEKENREFEFKLVWRDSKWHDI
jgi:hypothetical protein